MVLEASPDSSAFVRFATVAILYLHIASGGIGIASGAAALLMPKGGRAHRAVGVVFFVSMIIMAAIGAAVSPFLPEPQWANVFMGILVLFLVFTSWTTIHRKDHTVGTVDHVAFAFAVFMVAAALFYGITVALSPTHSTAGYLSAALFITMWALAALAERSLIARGGVFGQQRIVRHLWRMCVALLIAVFSLFLGQAKVFPGSVQGTGLLFVPPIAVALAFAYWLVRIRRAKNWRRVAYSS